MRLDGQGAVLFEGVGKGARREDLEPILFVQQLQVHEDAGLALRVEVRDAAGLDLGAVHRLAAAPALLQALPGAEVPQLGLHHHAGPARRRRLGRHLRHLPGIAVDLEDVAAADLRHVHAGRL
jgi:hypothetical protein